MTALPPDLQEAVETVKHTLQRYGNFHNGLDDAWPALKEVALIEQRLMEYERALSLIANGGYGDASVKARRALDSALAALASPKEKP